MDGKGWSERDFDAGREEAESVGGVRGLAAGIHGACEGEWREKSKEMRERRWRDALTSFGAARAARIAQASAWAEFRRRMDVGEVAGARG